MSARIDPARESDRPAPRPGVLDIKAYVPGKSHAPGVAKIYKLSSNETPLGPSARALAAYGEAARHLQDYPDGSAHLLREAIGRVHGLDPDRIICGAGSDEILSMIANTYLGPGDEAIHTEHGFLVYRIATLAAGGVPVVVRERDLAADVDAILQAVTPRTRVVFLANPNNPTGTYVPFDEVRRLHAGLPAHVLLVLDAAYAEYVRRNDYETGVSLALSAPNVVMTRTFSKIYGLAALRIGWAVGPAHVIDAMNRVRGPFNLNTPAQLAGAAAVADQAHIEEAVAHNTRWLAYLTGKITALGLKVTPSVANFLLIHFEDVPGRDAAAADAFLTKRGLVLRAVGAYGLPGSLRLTVGPEEANLLVVKALTDFLAGETR